MMMNKTYKSKRFCHGSYELTDGTKVVLIEKFSFGWVARAAWDRLLYTDGLLTKKEAMFNASLMLNNAN